MNMENYFKQWLTKKDTDSKIFSDRILLDLRNFAKNKSEESKVKMIYWRCIRMRHIKWANAIELKYSQYFRKSDAVMAFGYALMASKGASL